MHYCLYAKILVQKALHISLFLHASKPFAAVTGYQGSQYQFSISGFLGAPRGLVFACIYLQSYQLSTQCNNTLIQHYQFLPFPPPPPPFQGCTLGFGFCMHIPTIMSAFYPIQQYTNPASLILAISPLPPSRGASWGLVFACISLWSFNPKQQHTNLALSIPLILLPSLLIACIHLQSLQLST